MNDVFGAETLGRSGLDSIDELILDLLEEDGHATLSFLSQQTGLSISAVQSRVQKLERRGVILGYRAIVNHDVRGVTINAFVSVTPLDYSEEEDIPRKLEGIQGITSCHSVSGTPSYMLMVRVASPAELKELLNLIHRTVPVSTETTVILHTCFDK